MIRNISRFTVRGNYVDVKTTSKVSQYRFGTYKKIYQVVQKLNECMQSVYEEASI